MQSFSKRTREENPSANDRLAFWSCVGISLFFCFVACSQQSHCSKPFLLSSTILKQACEDTLKQMGYTLDTEHTSVDSMQTKPQNFLFPLRAGGHRSQVRIHIRKEGASQNRICLRVHREKNYSHHDFMNPQNAVWLSEGHDVQEENFLISTIEAKLDVLEKLEKKS